MANWSGKARTNYFKVKDPEQFNEWINSIPELKIITDMNKPGYFGLESICPDTGAFPSQIEDEEGDQVEFDIESDLAEHLAEGEVAILMEVGGEKLKYLTGWASAVAWDGRVERVNINDIYDKAAKSFGIDRASINACSY